MSPPTEAPHDVELEQALIGAVLVNDHAFDLVSDFLEADHFYEPIHAEIYRLFRLMRAGQRKITPTTLAPYLPDAEIGPEKKSLRWYIARLCAEATTVINAVDYARGICDLAARRKLLSISDNMATLAQGSGPDVTAIEQLEQADQALHELRRDLGSQESTTSKLQQSIEDLIVRAEDVRDGKGDPIPTTGFGAVDKTLGGGYRPGRLIVIAGRPGMGKTVLLAASSRRLARRSHGAFGVLINSLEIDRNETTARIMADELATTHMPLAYRDILNGSLDPAQLAKVSEMRERMADLPIIIDDSSSLTIAQIETRARLQRDRLAARGIKLGVLFIDYLGLVASSDRYRGRKVDEIGEVAKGAKEIAKRLGLCVVLLAQLNRAVESRDDKRPNMSDLRDSGEIENHADAVGLMYRPAYYIERDPKFPADPDLFARHEQCKFQLDLHFGKNRLGPAQTVKLFCNVAQSCVDDWRGS